MTSTSEDTEIKLADFGISKMSNESMLTFVGTPNFIAPEVISGKYSKECDIWSIGVLMYYLLSGQYPFLDTDLFVLLDKIKNGRVSFKGQEWAHISLNAKDLIKEFIKVKPYKRIRLSDALSHPWFKVLGADSTVPRGVFQRISQFNVSSKFWNCLLYTSDAADE